MFNQERWKWKIIKTLHFSGSDDKKFLRLWGNPIKRYWTIQHIVFDEDEEAERLNKILEFLAYMIDPQRYAELKHGKEIEERMKDLQLKPRSKEDLDPFIIESVERHRVQMERYLKGDVDDVAEKEEAELKDLGI